MVSILHELTEKYKGTTVDDNNSMMTTTVTYQGSRELCERALEDHSLIERDELGYIDNVKMSQDEGPHWNLEVKYVIEFVSDVNVIPGGGTAPSQPRRPIHKGSSKESTESELTIRMLSVPLETHPLYKLHWNYNLYATGLIYDWEGAWGNREETIRHLWPPHDDGVPIDVLHYWATAGLDPSSTSTYKAPWLTVWDEKGVDFPGSIVKDPITGQDISVTELMKNQVYWCWAKSYGECPMLPQGWKWHLMRSMTKPGQEVWEKPVYEVTESSQHSQKEAAQWAVKRSGRVIDPKNDFGIRGWGDWLCEGGSVQKAGKYWNANLSYLHSGDERGWDPDLYPRG